jgi:drug/metabolite transporter (DMT)-like permease
LNLTLTLKSACRWLCNAPLPLLVLTGTLLGSILPMSRVAAAAGWSPLAFAFWPALGSGLLLAAAGWWNSGRTRTARPAMLYSLITGALGVAIPNSVTFFVMPDLGTGLTSLMYTLAPAFTYAIAWLLRIERFRPLRLAGVVVGLGGAALMVLSRASVTGGSVWWLALALCAPLSLAMGNVYRKQYMARAMHAGLLGGGMLLGGALSLLPALLASGAWSPPDGSDWSVMLVQCGLTSVAYIVYFRFQKVADAVYFSQVGYVISATGVCSGLLLFQERLTMLLVLAIAVIIIGVAMVSSRAREPKA